MGKVPRLAGELTVSGWTVPRALQRLPGLLGPRQHQDALLHQLDPPRFLACRVRVSSLEVSLPCRLGPIAGKKKLSMSIWTAFLSL